MGGGYCGIYSSARFTLSIVLKSAFIFHVVNYITFGRQTVPLSRDKSLQQGTTPWYQTWDSGKLRLLLLLGQVQRIDPRCVYGCGGPVGRQRNAAFYIKPTLWRTCLLSFCFPIIYVSIKGEGESWIEKI